VNPTEVTERLEVSAEEPQPELSVEPEVSPLNPSLSNSSPGNPLWLRPVYALEFFIALIAIISVWSEVGGENHLELMPWYVKLVCILGLDWCCVRFTASIVQEQEIWTRRTITWLAGILLFCVAMGGITYYYHLREEPDDGDDDTTAAAVSIDNPGPLRNIRKMTNTRKMECGAGKFLLHLVVHTAPFAL
jgi:hypothetical protein